jgi:hypothetical protein
MTRAEALRSYTLDNAYAAFEETLKGSLTAGKLADVTVLSKDITTIPADEIPTARVVYTILGGRIAYADAAAGAPPEGRSAQRAARPAKTARARARSSRTADFSSGVL